MDDVAGGECESICEVFARLHHTEDESQGVWQERGKGLPREERKPRAGARRGVAVKAGGREEGERREERRRKGDWGRGASR